jgi:hypothetical protein
MTVKEMAGAGDHFGPLLSDNADFGNLAPGDLLHNGALTNLNVGRVCAFHFLPIEGSHIEPR